MSTASREFPGWYVELQAAVLRQLPRPGVIDQVTASAWIENQAGLKKGLVSCLLSPAMDVVVESNEESILRPVGGFDHIMTLAPFVAKEKFVVDCSRDAKVEISHLGDNFINWFLLGAGKIEGPLNDISLLVDQLLKTSATTTIIDELGGEEKAETTLTEMFLLMEKQGNGQDGLLLNDGCSNIFYIRDQNDVLRTVDLRWRGGWSICARSNRELYWWPDLYQVFSRKP